MTIRTGDAQAASGGQLIDEVLDRVSHQPDCDRSTTGARRGDPDDEALPARRLIRSQATDVDGPSRNPQSAPMLGVYDASCNNWSQTESGA